MALLKRYNDRAKLELFENHFEIDMQNTVSLFRLTWYNDNASP